VVPLATPPVLRTKFDTGQSFLIRGLGAKHSHDFSAISTLILSFKYQFNPEYKI
jgi:hypothetical protein